MSFWQIYLTGTGIVWLAAAYAYRAEPTVHGQDIIVPMGCVLGLLWPLSIAYLIVASPWIAVTWWQTRNER